MQQKNARTSNDLTKRPHSTNKNVNTHTTRTETNTLNRHENALTHKSKMHHDQTRTIPYEIN